MAYLVLHNAIFQRVRERHAEINEKYHGNYSKKFEEGVISLYKECTKIFT